ncbi:AAA family ATPase [Oceanibaculum indicum]|uniref:Uncharacterized protein DUF3696 n=1 Tax=Oceanibaculum indicum TaxID=526216 RepID=A0A420W9Z2_9PROT|nr:DUF3696 domain-containing protein [Oceanibaculum indicum]RKQ64143.1 uncharacterized protein DUF3696 [Oceanibaculum indicum]
MVRSIPVALHFSRYRAFKEEVRLPIAPLTLILGKNGSGKSVLTRLPVLIAGGIDTAAISPLSLIAGGVSHASRYEDLVHQRSAQPFMLGAEIAVDDTRIIFRTTLRHVVETHSLAYEQFELFKDDAILLRLSISSPEEIGKDCASFRFHFDGEDKGLCKVKFSGLFPSKIEEYPDVEGRVMGYRKGFEQAFGGPAYLGPFRSEASSSGRVPQQGVRALGPRGEGALDILGDDSLRGDGSTTRLVEEWFDTAMQGNRVVLALASGIPRLLVRDPQRNVEVDLSETGAGFAQVLPIAVQVLSAKNEKLFSPISIVEQPELHLHPGAHGALADLFVSATADPDVITKFVCETHSEQFVTRVRRRIAEGAIDHNDVLIISVAHQSEAGGEIDPVRIIPIDTYGNTETWPVGVFDEAFDDLIALREASVVKDEAPLRAD